MTKSDPLSSVEHAPLLLDVTRLIWRRWKGRVPTGIDRVALAYLDHFAGRAQAVIQHERFRGILGKNTSNELFSLLDVAGTWFKAALIAGMAKNLMRLHNEGGNRIYINVGHTGLNSQGFRTWVKKTGVKPVYLVHDLIPISHPRFARAGEDLKHRERILTVLTTATGIIANSGATLRELERFAASEKLPMPPATVAWLGTDQLQVPRASHSSNKRTFVTIGTIEARKNHLLLLDVWTRLIERLGPETPQLLIIGQRGWEATDVLRRLDDDERLRPHVVELSRCSDDELASHLYSARALLFPSHVEGYGLPLIEAAAAGVPAIASDLPVFRELCGSIPTYVDPTDRGAWERAILDYAEVDSASRADQIARMEGFRAPTWSEHFAKVEAFLATLS